MPTITEVVTERRAVKETVETETGTETKERTIVEKKTIKKFVPDAKDDQVRDLERRLQALQNPTPQEIAG